MSHGAPSRELDPSEQQMRAGEQPAKCCHGPGFSGLIPRMDIRSTCLSHVAMRVAMGGLKRPVPRPVKVLHRAPSSARPVLLLTLLAVLVVLAACSNAEPAAVPEEPSNPDATAPPGDPDNEPEPEPADDPPGAEELADVWEAFHAAWVEQATVDVPDPAAFEEVAADPVGVVEALMAQRGDSRLVTTETESWPRSDIDDDKAEVADCIIAEQHPDGQPDSVATVTIGWEATAVVTDDGWRIQDAHQLDLFCIAEELNDELLAAYATWLEAHSEWYEPPDPEHPLLEATMAGPGLSDMREVLADDRDAGISMRFPHETQAVVTELALETARVTDCYAAPDGYGAFDMDSGERRTGIVPAPEPGQLNRTVADLDRTEDGWRVVGWRWEEQNNCEPGETRYAPR
jgi:hypothetical protein